MLSYDIPKGFLKKLNNLNQDLKKVFSSYILTSDGDIVRSEYHDKIYRGQHVGFTDFELFDDIECNIKFNSEELFNILGRTKARISRYNKLIIEDDTVYLNNSDDDSLVMIGKIENDNIISHIDYQYNLLLELSDEDISKIIKNKYVDIDGKYSTRIAKELIPGLKKNYKLSVFFYDNKEDPRLFHLGIKCDRDSCYTIHIYTCIFI